MELQLGVFGVWRTTHTWKQMQTKCIHDLHALCGISNVFMLKTAVQTHLMNHGYFDRRKTRIPPIEVPCPDNDGSGISGLYLWHTYIYPPPHTHLTLPPHTHTHLTHPTHSFLCNSNQSQTIQNMWHSSKIQLPGDCCDSFVIIFPCKINTGKENTGILRAEDIYRAPDNKLIM